MHYSVPNKHIDSLPNAKFISEPSVRSQDPQVDPPLFAYYEKKHFAKIRKSAMTFDEVIKSARSDKCINLHVIAVAREKFGNGIYA